MGGSASSEGADQPGADVEPPHAAVPIASKGRDGRGGGALRRAERARDAAEESRDRFAFLAETSRCLADSLDFETTLATVAAMSLPYLGAWCIVDVCEEGGDVRRVAVVHPDPAKQALARELHERYPPRPDDLLGAPRVIRTGRPELVFDIPDAALVALARDPEHLRLLRELGVEAYVIVPMVARGRTLGAMTFVTAEAGRRFGDVDVVIAEDLARRAAMAVDNARLFQEAQEARRAAEEYAAEAEAAAEEAEAAMEEAEHARADAEGANRAKGEFLAVMSHELRTPLNAIAGYAELLALGVRGPVTPEQLADLDRIQRGQRQLLGLVNGLLNYARLEAGAVQYELRDVPVAEALAACAALAAPQADAKGVALEIGPCDPALRVRADAEKLQQILLNLLVNAVKFTNPGGRIAVRCPAADEADGPVALTVADTGIGIAPAHLGRIFEPFVQVDAALTRTREGVGLGLAISRELARGMGGELAVTSALGAGSTFTLTLPRS